MAVGMVGLVRSRAVRLEGSGRVFGRRLRERYRRLSHRLLEIGHVRPPL